MARIILTVFFSTTLMCLASAMTWTELGMSMSERAFKSVCWYEYLKQFPKTDYYSFLNCDGIAASMKKQSLAYSPEESQQLTFSSAMPKFAMNKIPSEYNDKCGAYLKDVNAVAPYDEGEVLNDNHYDKYPYRAFAYCLIHQLREKFGDQAIEDIKKEKLQGRKHWATTLLDRENKNRARHGAPPFNYANELEETAQKWADKIASECNTHHSDKNDVTYRMVQGQETGENIASFSIMQPIAQEDASYAAAGSWYQEIKDYPWPEFTGSYKDDFFEKIGHFTQTVWKESANVGYGIAFNMNCNPKLKQPHVYIVGHYYPAGNFDGSYGKNVGAIMA